MEALAQFLRYEALWQLTKSRKLHMTLYWFSMPEISHAIESTSLFAGVLGLLFANWIQDAQRAAGQPLPTHYSDRKLYFGSVLTVFFVKSLPLTVIFSIFIYSYFPIALSIFFHSTFLNLIYENRNQIQIEWTTFSLVYGVIVYFGVLSFVCSVQLIRAIFKARKGRTSSQPRIHILG